MGTNSSILKDEYGLAKEILDKEAEKYEKNIGEGLNKAGKFSGGLLHKTAHNLSSGLDNVLLPIAGSAGKATSAYMNDESFRETFTKERNLMSKSMKTHLKNFEMDYPIASGAINILTSGKDKQSKAGNILQSILDAEDDSGY